LVDVIDNKFSITDYVQNGSSKRSNYFWFDLIIGA
jgi:hypothetical protein